MAWNILNLDTALVARLEARASLIAMLAGANSIRPEGTGKELFPSVNFNFMDAPDPNLSPEHEVTLFFYIDGQDSSGVSGYEQVQNIAAEIVAELNRDPQKTGAPVFLNLSGYSYRCHYQRVANQSIPVLQTGESPATFRKVLIFKLVITDYS